MTEANIEAKDANALLSFRI